MYVEKSFFTFDDNIFNARLIDFYYHYNMLYIRHYLTFIISTIIINRINTSKV